MKEFTNNVFKYMIGLVVVILLRLVPHPPNVEPIMTAMMPFAKRWGVLSGAFFAAASIIIYDLVTGTLGSWTLITLSTYALLGGLAGLFFAKKENTLKNYVIFAVFATLIYDAITGIAMGVLIYHMPFEETLIGQIPFTVNHLLGNIVFAIVLSPVIFRWVVENPKIETWALLSHFDIRNW